MIKKVFTFLCCSIFIFFLETGCSEQQNSDFSIQEEITAIDNLKAELLSLNRNYIVLNPQTRSRWWRWLIFGAADVSGTLLGGWSTGISASSLAWTVTKDLRTNDKETEMFSYEEAMELEEGSAGYVHNAVLIKAFYKYGDEIYSKSTSEMVDIISEEFIGSTDDISLQDKEEAVVLLDRMMDEFDISSSVSEYMDKMKTLTADESTKESIEICKIVLEGLEMVEVADTGYIDAVMKTIENSSVKEPLKENITDGVSVAYASSILWDEVQP